MGTVIVGSILGIVIGLVVKYMIKGKKQGKSIQCGDSCKYCGGHCHKS